MQTPFLGLGSLSLSCEWISAELSGAQLPDQRFRRHLQLMCERLFQHPGRSFSAACGPGVRKAGSRLFSYPQADLLRGHRQETIKRAATYDRVLVASDTTEINYDSHKGKKGLGTLHGRFATQGWVTGSQIFLSIFPTHVPATFICSYGSCMCIARSSTMNCRKPNHLRSASQICRCIVSTKLPPIR